ncbi:MAG: TRAP transporter small permease subunit [Rubrivivax sp.]
MARKPSAAAAPLPALAACAPCRLPAPLGCCCRFAAPFDRARWRCCGHHSGHHDRGLRARLLRSRPSRPWASSRYAGLGLIFLTVPLLLAHDAHVKVDLLRSACARQAGVQALALFNDFATLAFCGLFLVSCWWFMQRAARFLDAGAGHAQIAYYLLWPSPVRC